MNDVRKTIYATIIGFFLMLLVWFSIVYVSSCGFTFTCNRGDLPVERTPIPTLIPASHGDVHMEVDESEYDKCLVSSSDLVGAWVESGAPESEPFTFTDMNGASCTGTYDEVQTLFVENSVWQSGTLGCVSCHNAELTDRSGGLDMSTYDAISASGVLGSSWTSSSLREYLGMALTVDGHSSDASGGNPLIYVGAAAPEEEAE
ncbi:MAG TPA: hypothetical protein VLA72_15230 [Anaerolineales bacterium]|nr:hypothetical protein [Anaerolineales bacterium]